MGLSFFVSFFGCGIIISVIGYLYIISGIIGIIVCCCKFVFYWLVISNFKFSSSLNVRIME